MSTKFFRGVYNVCSNTPQSAIRQQLTPQCRKRLASGAHLQTHPFSTNLPRRSPWPPFPASTSHRSSFRSNFARLFHTAPISISLATLFILGGAISLRSVPYFYRNEVEVLNAKYPEEVAKKLRRAIHYTIIEPNAKDAFKYYKMALVEANKAGMQEWSDEVTGIKIQVASMFESMGRLDKAVEALELVFADAAAFVEKQDALQENPSPDGPLPAGTRDRQARSRVLKRMIRMSTKLAELYADDRLGARNTSEEKLVWGATTTLKERARRQGMTPEQESLEGDWMSEMEIAASLESLAMHYMSTRQNYLAAPLLLQAVGLVAPGKRDCHTCTLMNNLASALLKQNPPPGYSHLPPSSSPEAAASARAWVQKAIQVANGMTPQMGRTEECDIASATATVNMGEIALVEGDKGEARRWFEEGKAISKAIAWGNGVKEAEEGLKGLGKG